MGFETLLPMLRFLHAVTILFLPIPIPAAIAAQLRQRGGAFRDGKADLWRREIVEA
jgi:hypothetical protein